MNKNHDIYFINTKSIVDNPNIKKYLKRVK